MFRKLTPKFTFFITLALLVALAGTALVQAAVRTDKPDYLPGSVVTISGDNSDGAGFLPGETVNVAVTGPNGYTDACEAVADDAGAWSCQVTLWANELAIGDYAYTATGAQSNVSQNGTFKDGNADISGTVSDANGPISGATVVCTTASGCSQDNSTTTNGQGNYSFNNLSFNGQSASPSLTASKAGYQSQTQSISLVHKGTFTLNFSLSLNPTKADQSITFAALSGKTYGDAPFTVSATASSNLPVSFAASGNCSVSGNTVTITGAGSCAITASQAGNSSFNAAQDVTQSFTISIAGQTITFGALANKTYGDVDFGVSATSSSGQIVTFSASGSCTISGSMVHLTGAGSCAITASAGGSNDYNAATPVTQTFSIAKASQSITFVALPGKTYGDSSFDLNATATSGLTVAFTAAGQCTVSGATVTITGAGSCTITASQPGNDNFNAATSVTQPFAIAKATPVITWANPSDIVYGTLLSATQLNASAGVEGTLTYNPAAGTKLDAGPAQALKVDFAPSDSANYNTASTTVSINVAKAPLTVSAKDKSKTYGDEVTFTGTEFTTSGLVNGDSVSNVTLTSTGAAATAIVGSYEIVPNAASGTGLTNYDIKYVPGMLTVNPAPLTVTAESTSREYGEPNPPFTATITGFKNGETLATSGITGAASLTTSATPTSPVSGSPYAINAAIGDLTAANYSFTLVNGELTITKATLTVTADNKNRVYGDANPTFSATITGYKNGETLATSGVTGAASLTTSATPTSPVSGSPYTITAAIGDLAAANYSFIFVDGNLMVTKAPLTVTAESTSRVYGDANPTFSATINGFKNGETQTAVVSGAPELATSAIATSSVIGTYPITATVGTLAAANYSFTFVPGTMTITKAPLTVTTESKSKEYGETFTAFTGSVVGLKNGEIITATYDSTGAAAEAGVAGSPYDITATLSDPDSKLGNYAVSNNFGKLTVTKAPLTVTADSTNRMYGDANPPLSGKIVGTKNGDAITASYGTTADEKSPVGNYPITPSAFDSTPSTIGNYEVTFVPGTLTITKAPLTITAKDQTKIYGALFTFAGTEFTTNADGLVNGDTVTGVTLTSAGTAATATVGSYPIVPSAATGTGLTNYTISYSNGSLKVDPKALTITADNKTKTYGDAVSFAGTEFTTNAGGLVNGDKVTGVTLTSDGAAAKAVVNTYDIVASVAIGTGLGNYTIGYVNGSLKVDPKALTITANSQTKTYGEAVIFAGTEFTPSGLVNSDIVTGVTLTSDGAAANAVVNTYDIVASAAVGTGLGNYTITYEKGTLTVDQAPLTVTVNDQTKFYGDTFTGSLTGSIAGIKNNDQITATYSSAAVDASKPVGTYAIIPTLSAGENVLANYHVSIVLGKFTITQAPLSVTPDNKTKFVGATFTAFTGTVTGIKNNDNITATYSSAGAVASAPIGTYLITATLNDPDGKLGNYAVTINTNTLMVIYRFDGFLQPINDTAHQIGQLMSIFKGGSTVPVKFQLKDASGKVVQSSSAPLWISPAKGSPTTGAVDESLYSDPASSGNTYRWDATSQQYIYNWSTKGSTVGYFYRIGVQFDDGQTYYVYIGLK